MQRVIPVLLASTAASVSAQTTILSFTFSDLNGSFVPSSTRSDEGTFSALADADSVSGSGLNTNGDVTRLVGPGADSAEFEDGFVASSSFADVNITMTVTSLDTVDNTGTGVGTFAITDADGDVLGGTLSGSFSDSPAPGLPAIPGFIFFNGFLTDVGFTTTSGSTSTFDGTDGGSFSTDFPAAEPFEGAFVQLSFGGGTSFFNGSGFSDVSTQASGILIPTPASAALLAAGGLAAVRRRR
ncbi:MAG: hypothetical protein AAF747_04665 [Planctomycetota bacterium]